MENLTSLYCNGENEVQKNSLWTELLPDTDQLKDIISRIKPKLKIIEEISSSQKFMKSDINNITQLAKSTKESVIRMQKKLDNLEVLISKNTLLMDYIIKIKNSVVRPVIKFINDKLEAERLNIENNSTTESSEYRLVQNTERVYNHELIQPLLVSVVRSMEEAIAIEKVVAKMFKPLRHMVGVVVVSDKSPVGKEVGGMKSSVEGMLYSFANYLLIFVKYAILFLS